MYTIDTSVWVNSVDTTEVGYALSRQFLRLVAVQHSQLVLPTLVLPEIAGAIARTRADAALGEAFAQQVAALPNCTLVSLDQPLADLARALAAQHRLRGADAVYVAVAQIYGTTLVSLDNEHLTRIVTLVRMLRPADGIAELSSLPSS